MKWIVGVIVAIFIGGCATDTFYNAGKTIYIAGKKVIVANWESLPPDVQEKLKEIDKAATTYDSARKVLKPAVEEAVRSVKSDLEKNKSKSLKSSAGGE